MSRCDCVVIGAGVVGLAIGRALAQAGYETLIVEREKLIGSQTSSRNSEVIHAGIYYPPGSLKAQSCVAGRDRLYSYCADRGIPHRRCGKFIVATAPEQLGALETIVERAHASGVSDLFMIDGVDAIRQEPELNACAALVSPSTGIVDSHAFMLAVLGDAENAGALLALGADVTGLRHAEDGIDVFVSGDAEPAVRAGAVINAAGLDAARVAALARDYGTDHVPPTWMAKGNYFILQGRAPFSRLIYPVPEPGGLGTHLTIDMGGAARFGPDVEWVDHIDYDVAPDRADRFYDAVRRYWPGLRDGALQPGYSGIRPKLSGPGQPAADFVIAGPDDHGVPRLINLYGIESPGLTASLDLADRVAALAAEAL